MADDARTEARRRIALRAAPSLAAGRWTARRDVDGWLVEDDAGRVVCTTKDGAVAAHIAGNDPAAVLGEPTGSIRERDEAMSDTERAAAFYSAEPVTKLIRRSLLDAMADPEGGDCSSDEADCFRRHPVHLGWAVGDEVEVVYVQVDKVGSLIADALANAGRLLPDGGETRTEWGVHWHVGDGDGDGVAGTDYRLRDHAEAVERGASRVGIYGITRYSVHRREHRIFGEHGSWTGPWVEVTDV